LLSYGHDSMMSAYCIYACDKMHSKQHAKGIMLSNLQYSDVSVVTLDCKLNTTGTSNAPLPPFTIIV